MAFHWRQKIHLGVILIFLGSIAPISLWGEFIKAPEPTHVERNFVPLELVKEINQDIDDRNFLAKPVALTVDDEGGLYVYDKRLIKIFKFDRNFKLVKTFAGQGRGPGELFGNSLPGQILEFWRGNLYVSDDGNRKIVVFSKKGERVREIPLPSTFVGLFPMLDARGNY
ncbi:MAG: hypothetical protein GY765_14140 [bacterium]|nr:hypothetical protein [bacterium]